MIAGRGTPDQAPARALLYRDPATFDALMARIEAATIGYLLAQIAAGAEVIKLFDSWAGALPGPLFARYAIAPARRIAAALRAAHPGGAGHRLPPRRRRRLPRLRRRGRRPGPRPRHRGRSGLGRPRAAAAALRPGQPRPAAPGDRRRRADRRRPRASSRPSPAARTSSTSATASPPTPTPPTSTPCSARSAANLRVPAVHRAGVMLLGRRCAGERRPRGA